MQYSMCFAVQLTADGEAHPAVLGVVHPEARVAGGHEELVQVAAGGREDSKGAWTAGNREGRRRWAPLHARAGGGRAAHLLQALPRYHGAPYAWSAARGVDRRLLQTPASLPATQLIGWACIEYALLMVYPC